MTQDPIIGGSLLLTYTTGYVAPLLLAASFAGALQVFYVPTYNRSFYRTTDMLLAASCHYSSGNRCTKWLGKCNRLYYLTFSCIILKQHLWLVQSLLLLTHIVLSFYPLYNLPIT